MLHSKVNHHGDPLESLGGPPKITWGSRALILRTTELIEHPKIYTQTSIYTTQFIYSRFEDPFMQTYPKSPTQLLPSDYRDLVCIFSQGIKQKEEKKKHLWF